VARRCDEMLDARPGPAAHGAPRLLSALRLVLAPLYVLALEASATLPLAIALIAAVSDFVDGRLARRLGTASRAGAVLDVVADGVFVLTALSALAAAAVVSWLLPLAVALALSAFGLAAARGHGALAPGDGDPTHATHARGPADRAGHAAGVVNYAVVIAGSVALAGWVTADWLTPVSVAVAIFNLSPLLLRAARPAA
jgi:phosphatidylglycerophosphate synthase